MSHLRRRNVQPNRGRWWFAAAVVIGLLLGVVGTVVVSPSPAGYRVAHPAVLAAAPVVTKHEAVPPTGLGTATPGIPTTGDAGRAAHATNSSNPGPPSPHRPSTAQSSRFVPSAGADPVTYVVAFNATGLNSTWNTVWSVTFNGTERSSNTTTKVSFRSIQFWGIPNGTYNYTIEPLANYTLKGKQSSGNVSLPGTKCSKTWCLVSVTWSLVTYHQSFVETGLPKSTSWSVVVDGITKGTTSNKVTFSLSNGTYPFDVVAVKGYRVSPPNGNVTMNGANASQTLKFNSISSGGGGSGSPTVYYVLGGGIAVLAVAVILALALLRRRRKARAAPTPPAEPSTPTPPAGPAESAPKTEPPNSIPPAEPPGTA